MGNSNDISANNLKISTGDDCISIGPGSSNINISEVYCGPGHGISIGSLGKYQDEGDVNGVVVRNCTIVRTTNGARIKSWAPSPPSKVFNVTFEDINVEYAENPIIIDQQYCPRSSCNKEGNSQVEISNVKFIDIRGISASKVAVSLNCSKSVPCQGIELRGLDLIFNGQEATTATCSNANMSFYGQQTPSGFKSSQVHGKGAVFNVQDFGAFPDGKTDSSQAFLKAWNQTCQIKEGGTIFIPTGTFLLNTVTFNGPCNGQTIFNINGVLRAPSGESRDEFWILFQHINGLTINGKGSLDGQGPSAWSLTSDSPNLDDSYSNSNDISANNLKISTGDDCISIGPGSSNINISEVHCGPGHGISIGSLGKYQDEGDVNGVIVKNCTIVRTTNGARIKSWAPSPPSKVFNVTFEDINVQYAENPIIIDQQYCPHSSCSKEGNSQVEISNVKFINIRGIAASKVAVSLNCSKSVPCQGIELRGLDLIFNGQEATTATCSNANMSFYGQQTPSGCT
ncbi:exopolygalacturonase-like [Lycium ferocissimum]|uniref:exopolygalacturonase-like n=1 Tax=Lycium ferocissimum TaxID=112874 RepID=UPI002815499D|nr:exopolygalacturonase-like [Lycium ferocissimum]